MEYILETTKDGKEKKRKAEKSVCKQCGNAYLKQLRFKGQKYCSKECSALARKDQEEVECRMCKSNFKIAPSRKDGRVHFCSRSCKDEAMRIKNGIREIWPDHYGEFSKDYRRIAFESLDKRCACGEGLEHRLVVHHKDGNRKNNNKENLEIVCRNCHADRHLKMEGGKWKFSYQFLTPRSELSNFISG